MKSNQSKSKLRVPSPSPDQNHIVFKFSWEIQHQRRCNKLGIVFERLNEQQKESDLTPARNITADWSPPWFSTTAGGHQVPDPAQV